MVRTPEPVATQVTERLRSSSVITYSVGGSALLHPDPGSDGERPVVQASNRGHCRRPLRPQLDLAQHLPDPLDRVLDVEPGALLHRPSCSSSPLEIDQDHVPHTWCITGAAQFVVTGS